MKWNNRLTAVTMVAIMVCSFAWGRSMSPSIAEASPASQPTTQHIPADQTRAVQSVLSSYGYTVVVDGIYGPQTTKAVKSWQKSNGLLQDGIAGPITQASLGIGTTQPTASSTQTSTPPAASSTHEHYDRWVKLAQCESGGNWSINTGNGYYGGLQFALSSWRAVGGAGYPHEASIDEQMLRAEKLLDIQGWKAWPACSRKFGWR